MKICHLSDSHGRWPKLPDSDIVVHSGDMLPNRTRGIVPVELHYQEGWLQQNMQWLKDSIGSRPFLFVPGNHDYFDPIPHTVAAGIDARDARGVSNVDDIWFYGFAGVPYFTGEWNHEMSENQIAQGFQPPVDTDVIIAHAPIYGVLDRNANGTRCGSKAIRAAMQSGGSPAWYLHGHIHEAAGVQGWSHDVMVSNAATTFRVIVV